MSQVLNISTPINKPASKWFDAGEGFTPPVDPVIYQTVLSMHIARLAYNAAHKYGPKSYLVGLFLLELQTRDIEMFNAACCDIVADFIGR